MCSTDGISSSLSVLGGGSSRQAHLVAKNREVVSILNALKASRDMTAAEARLVVMIDDPAAAEKRKLGIEDERGVSRDEMAAALDDITGGRVPKDRIALKCLTEEMRAWPL